MLPVRRTLLFAALATAGSLPVAGPLPAAAQEATPSLAVLELVLVVQATELRVDAGPLALTNGASCRFAPGVTYRNVVVRLVARDGATSLTCVVGSGDAPATEAPPEAATPPEVAGPGDRDTEETQE